MPIPVPNLDDRTFQDLADEGRSLISRYAPEWTNHNPSDPGITLIELFAFLTELNLYRLNRVTDDNVRSFLRLLNGAPADESTPLDEQVKDSLLLLQKRDRAISSEDFVALAREADSRVARGHCLPRRQLTSDFEADAPGHVTVLVVPYPSAEADLGAITIAVQQYLEPRRLLTTRVHVLGPQFASLSLSIEVVARADQDETRLRASIQDSLADFFRPASATEGDEGWPFGRDVYIAELYEKLDGHSGVDYVTRVEATPAEPSRLQTSAGGDVIGVEIKDYELPKLTGASVSFFAATS